MANPLIWASFNPIKVLFYLYRGLINLFRHGLSILLRFYSIQISRIWSVISQYTFNPIKVLFYHKVVPTTIPVPLLSILLRFYSIEVLPPSVPQYEYLSILLRFYSIAYWNAYQNNLMKTFNPIKVLFYLVLVFLNTDGKSLSILLRFYSIIQLTPVFNEFLWTFNPIKVLFYLMMKI